MFFFFKQKTAYEMRISDWSSDVCSSDLQQHRGPLAHAPAGEGKREKGDQHDRRHQGETVGKGERQAEALRQQVGGAHRQKLRQRRKQQQREGGRRRQQQPASVARQRREGPSEARRAEERRVGEEGVRTGRSRGARENPKKKK